MNKLTLRQKRVTFILWLSLLCGLLLFQYNRTAVAGESLIPNARFEQGENEPAGWSLAQGNGDWRDTGNEHGRVLAVSGNGSGGVYWHSEPVDFENGALYELAFSARSVDAGGSSVISGPRFSNTDHEIPAEQWKRFHSILVVPGTNKPSWSRIRLGGWKVNGTILFDDVVLKKIQPLHHRHKNIRLGEGESLQDHTYEFDAPLGKESGGYTRSLARKSCRFHSNRWWFDPGSSVVYRHRPGGFRQTSASVQIGSGYRRSGKLLVECRTGSTSWKKLGTVSETGQHQFDLPESLFPAEEVRVRLRAPSGNPVNLQVDSYSYQSTVDDAGLTVRGKTYFLKILQERKPLRVRIRPEGRLTLGKRVRAVVTNRSDQPVEASWSGVAKTRNGQSKNEWSSEPRTFEPGKQTVTFPFHVAGPGRNRIELRLGNYFEASMRMNVSTLYQKDYGRLLPTTDHENVRLWWCKAGWKVSRRRPVPSRTGEALTVRSARNEAEAAQLVFHPERQLRNVRVQAEPLHGPGPSTLSPERIDLLRVRYVNVDQPTDEAGEPGYWPDPLPSIDEPFTMQKGRNQPIWIRVNVPKNQEPGQYEGNLRLRADEFEATVPIRVHVFDFRLPDRMTLTTSFGFSAGKVWSYQNLDKTSHRENVLKKYWKTFSEHHVSPYDPAPMAEMKTNWPDTDDPEKLDPEMDFSRWDKRISRAINKYHFNSFRLNPPGLGGGNFHNRWQPSMLGYEEGTPQYRAAFKNYYRKLESHLRENGWLDEAYIYWFDEPQPKDYEFVMNGFQKLKSAAPDIRRMLTEEVNDELIGGPNVWCPLLSRYNHERARERRKHNETFWWYICTAPKSPYAGLFIDRPATDLRVWLWQTWKRNISGILVWRTNYWTSTAAYPDSRQNPYEDPMSWQSGYRADEGEHIPWGNGDGRFLYPPESAADGNPGKPVLKGPVESIRWEMLRDGIEDYEYLAMLKRRINRKKDQLKKQQIDEYTSLLDVPPAISRDRTHFTKEPGPIKKRRLRIAEAIESLDDID